MAADTRPRPNIVLITTDKQRGDCLGSASHYGFDITGQADSPSAGSDNDYLRFKASFMLRDQQTVRVAQLRVLF